MTPKSPQFGFSVRRMRWAQGVCLLAALSLMAACGKKEEPEPEPEPEMPASAIAPAPKPQEPLPLRVPGLWELSKTEDGTDDMAQVMQVCTDAKTEARMGVTKEDLSGETCVQTMVSHLEDGSWGILAQCDRGTAGVTEISATITGDYTRNYVMTTRAQTTGAAAPHMNRVVNTELKWKRLSACKAEQRPGDVIVAGGETFNLYEMSGLSPE